MDFSIDDVGIVYASIRKVLKIVAAITAKPIASTHDRSSLFFFFTTFFFVFFQNIQGIVCQKIMSPAIKGTKYNHSPLIK